MRYIQKVFSSRIDKRQPKDNLEYSEEGVKVKRINIKKIIPRSDYSSSVVKKHVKSIFSYLKNIDFNGDII